MIKNVIILEMNIKYNNSIEGIINSLENIKREDTFLSETKENEEEIKDLLIYIND